MRPLHHRMLRLAPVVLLLASATAASAQSNTISILQEGSGNTLTVDQSDAAGSSVEGLAITRSTRSFTQPEIRDGDEVVQEAITVDLEVLGVGSDRGLPAQQFGDNNTASVTIRGLGGSVGLLQDNPIAAGIGNNAVALVTNGGTAWIGQEGSGNRAGVGITGMDSEGAILQVGAGNRARLSVTGDNASGLISQIGNNNNTPLSVTGNGTSVEYYVDGNNAASVSPQGVQVISNGASVTITQTPGF